MPIPRPQQAVRAAAAAAAALVAAAVADVADSEKESYEPLPLLPEGQADFAICSNHKERQRKPNVLLDNEK